MNMQKKLAIWQAFFIYILLHEVQKVRKNGLEGYILE